MTVAVPVLVYEDTVYRAERRDQQALLFMPRTAITVTALPLALVTPRPRPWTLDEDKFQAALPVWEADSQTSTTPGASLQPFSLYFKAQRPDPEPEFQIQRFDHQMLFRLRGPETAQLIGYTFNQPDFNDNPWLEEVHRPANPEVAIFPFRQIPQFIRGQQFNLFFNQPRPYWIDAEYDTVARRPDTGVLPYSTWRAPSTTTVPNVVGLTQAAAIIALNNVTLLALPITTNYSATVALGLVISQSPAAGTVVSLASDVALVISLGPIPSGYVPMTSVVGLILEQAEYNLIQAGVVVPGAIGYFGTWPISVIAKPSSAPPLTVIAQSPAAGQFIVPNSPILLTISEPPSGFVYPAGYQSAWI